MPTWQHKSKESRQKEKLYKPKKKAIIFDDVASYSEQAVCGTEGGASELANTTTLLSSCEGDLISLCDDSTITESTALHDQCKGNIAQYNTEYERCRDLTTTDIFTCVQSLIDSPTTKFLTKDCNGIAAQSIAVVEKFVECTGKFKDCRKAEDSLLIKIPNCVFTTPSNFTTPSTATTETASTTTETTKKVLQLLQLIHLIQLLLTRQLLQRIQRIQLLKLLQLIH